MSDTRKAHERLDALLTGLEDEVLRGEGVLTTDIKALRAEVDRLIVRHAGRNVGDNRVLTSEDVKKKGITAKTLLERLAGIGQRAVHGNAMPRVRTAFSGKRKLPENGGRTNTRRKNDSGEKEG